MRAVCAIDGSNHGCVGHKHAHSTVVPIFVEHSPFWNRIASRRAETEGRRIERLNKLINEVSSGRALHYGEIAK
jgi:hypothetical protein